MSINDDRQADALRDILDVVSGDTRPMSHVERFGLIERMATAGLTDPDYPRRDPLAGADCNLCGATADNFHVPDELWDRVGLGQRQVCFKCFRIEAWSAGVRPQTAWEVTLG